jgi:hypothetical protein
MADVQPVSMLLKPLSTSYMHNDGQERVAYSATLRGELIRRIIQIAYHFPQKGGT